MSEEQREKMNQNETVGELLLEIEFDDEPEVTKEREANEDDCEKGEDVENLADDGNFDTEDDVYEDFLLDNEGIEGIKDFHISDGSPSVPFEEVTSTTVDGMSPDTSEALSHAETEEEQRLRAMLVPGRCVWFDLDADFRLQPEGLAASAVAPLNACRSDPQTESSDSVRERGRRPRGPPARLEAYRGKKTLRALRNESERDARQEREGEGEGEGEDEETLTTQDSPTHTQPTQPVAPTQPAHTTTTSTSFALSRAERERLLRDDAWVDFALGQDVRDARRDAQDVLWAQAVRDGRTHLSHREFALAFKPRFLQGIEYYKIVRLLVLGMYSRKSVYLCGLTEEVLTLIVEFAFAGQGPLVRFLSEAEQCLASLREEEEQQEQEEEEDLEKLCLYDKGGSCTVNDNFTKAEAVVVRERCERSLSPPPPPPFRVCVRVRPLLPAELSQGSYAVVSTPSARACVLHEGRLARSARLLSLTHHFCAAHRVYGARESTHTLCEESLRPLCERVVRHGASATLLLFGQTGTGKTHTLYGALHYLAHTLADTAHTTNSTQPSHTTSPTQPAHTSRPLSATPLGVRVTFYEVHGQQCYDLLNARRRVALRFDSEERCHVRGARSVTLAPLSAASQLLSVLAEGLALRASLVTERNAMSSRSHAVCVLEILQRVGEGEGETHKEKRGESHTHVSRSRMSLAEYLSLSSHSHSHTDTHNDTHTDIPYNSPTQHPTPHRPSSHTHSEEEEDKTSPAEYLVRGRLTLVDLAGSERNYETTSMSAAQHRESADINLSLMTLKQCFHAFHHNLRALSAHNALSQQQLQAKGFSQSHLAHTTQRADTMPSGLKRVPYRASTLTKVLKDCFTLPSHTTHNTQLHHTTVIATLSPTPTDLTHSLNTVQHVLLMTPALFDRYYATQTVEVPTTQQSALSSLCITQWTHTQVQEWLAHVERGKFAHIALPSHVDGKVLVEMTAASFAALFVQQERSGRVESEGPTWTISVEETRRLNSISNTLVRAIQRELWFFTQRDNKERAK